MKSVNGRGLDVRSRLPSGFDEVDANVRKSLAARFSRGNIQVGLQFEQRGAAQELRVNQEVLGQVLRELAALRGKPGTTEARLDGVLALRGVLELTEPDTAPEQIEARDLAIVETLEDAIESLRDSRVREGMRIETDLRDHLDTIVRLVEQAETLAATRQESFRDRLNRQIDDLLADRPGLPEERLAQEIAVLMVKADVTEEIQRLRTHVDAALEGLAASEPIGRRLDFLCQEFNREANTLCSKAGDPALTAVGLDLKVVIDRFREQVQNVE